MVVARIRDLRSSGDLVVVTGGEPLAQAEGLSRLLDALEAEQAARSSASKDFEVHLETAGVPGMDLRLLSRFETVVVSPKLHNAGPTAMRHSANVDYGPVAALDHVWFKFVVVERADFQEVAEFEAKFNLRRIMVMAEGVDPDASLALTRDLVDEVVARGWSLSPRLHIWLWGDQRGR